MRGADKLLQAVDGVTVLRRQAEAALAAGADVVACLAPDRPERREALAGLDLRCVTVADAVRGMSASIRAGVAALPEGCTGVMILPADMPEIDADDLRAVLAAFDTAGRDRVARGASQDGTPGHPVLFPSRLFAALSGLTGDAGARSVLRGEDVVLVSLPGCHALVDLDTPEDWAAWRASRGN